MLFLTNFIEIDTFLVHNPKTFCRKTGSWEHGMMETPSHTARTARMHRGLSGLLDFPATFLVSQPKKKCFAQFPFLIIRHSVSTERMVMFSHMLVHLAAIGSLSSFLISRPSEKSRMRCPDHRGRESWDWAEQKSLYKKNSPHKVGEETFD